MQRQSIMSFMAGGASDLGALVLSTEVTNLLVRSVLLERPADANDELTAQSFIRALMTPGLSRVFIAVEQPVYRPAVRGNKLE